MPNPLNVKRFFQSSSEEVLVKICGIKTEGEAMSAIKSGADALGFNLYTGSRRYIDWLREKSWIRQLPPEISRVAVVVNPTLAEFLAMTEDDTFDAIQLHGDEAPDFFKNIPQGSKRLIKAFRVRDRSSLKLAESYPVFAFLLDGWKDGYFGGTGKEFEWDALSGVTLNRPIIVAGGLNRDNVGKAVRLLKPHAVDVASGVENREGAKDEAKMSAFVSAAKQGQTED
jgi:phosphoribosylanthranilate isomerase